MLTARYRIRQVHIEPSARLVRKRGAADWTDAAEQRFQLLGGVRLGILQDEGSPKVGSSIAISRLEDLLIVADQITD